MPNGNNNQSVTPMDDVLPPMPQTGGQSTVNNEQDIINPSPTDSGSAAPSDDLVISQVVGSTPPKKKYAGGKIIATILGLFLLVGGVGAGVFLTQENQNPNEKAAGGLRYEHLCYQNKGQPSEQRKWCWDYSDPECGTDPGHPVECPLPAPWKDCEPVTEPCGAGGGGGGSGTPVCIGPVEAFDTSWNKLTSAQLSQIKVGDKIRFTVNDQMGSTVGNATVTALKARFTINGVLRPEVTTKNPAGNKFYDEYTVTAADLNLTTFNVKAEVGILNKWGS